MGLRPGRPVDKGMVSLDDRKVGLPDLSFVSPLSLSPRIPRQSSPPFMFHYLQGALA